MQIFRQIFRQVFNSTDKQEETMNFLEERIVKTEL